MLDALLGPLLGHAPPPSTQPAQVQAQPATPPVINKCRAYAPAQHHTSQPPCAYNPAKQPRRSAIKQSAMLSSPTIGAVLRTSSAPTCPSQGPADARQQCSGNLANAPALAPRRARLAAVSQVTVFVKGSRPAKVCQTPCSSQSLALRCSRLWCLPWHLGFLPGLHIVMTVASGHPLLHKVRGTA